ncbi:hypothetical protein MN116_007783 [Schistosoma mekongi]|uniref:WD repeat-containing protein 89 n=1 Tax=Schistosoma mekongi TaxID=38744 RepID=A0AAE1Z6N7_SCHME|nr:hypothetical protein MN116_007783 [Schistosoma mekongi]
MLNIVSHLPQKYSDNILVTHNNHDIIYEVRGFQLHSIHLPSMQVDNTMKNISIETNLVDIDYSPGISSILSCSDKGDIHIWDMRDNVSQLTICSNRQFKDIPFTCCSISTDGSLICCGTQVYRVKKSRNKRRRKRNNSRESSEQDEETAQLVYWDTRNLSSPLGSLKDFHSDDIVDVKFDPTSVPGYLRLMDCSEDGVLCLYDMNGEAISQDNSLLYMFNSESVASSCDWLVTHHHSSDSIVGVYCTTTMRSSIKAWPTHSSMLHHSVKDGSLEKEDEKINKQNEDEGELNLSEKDEKDLNEKTLLWNSKFKNADNTLKGKNFFNMLLIQEDSSDEFLLLGENSGDDTGDYDKNFPTVFHSHSSHKSTTWTESCLPTTMNNSKPINNNANFNLQYADFLGKINDCNDTKKQLCFMVGSQSTVLCSYEILPTA